MFIEIKDSFYIKGCLASDDVIGEIGISSGKESVDEYKTFNYLLGSQNHICISNYLDIEKCKQEVDHIKLTIKEYEKNDLISGL